MRRLPERARSFQPAGVALAAAFSALLAIQAFAAQEAHKPLGEKEVINLLTNDVAPPRVGELAKQFGISFRMTPSAEKDLRDAGATESLIETLRALEPKATAPAAQSPPEASSAPVLLIDSSPGNSQVYIDDEPVGTTSPEGRLKLPKLGAGTHRVRVAHEGFKDFEQTVQLDSGLVTVTAELEPAAAANSSPPESSSAPPTRSQPQSAGSAAQTGIIGMFFRTANNRGGPAGQVTALIPGGPAEQAGIRLGNIIVSIAGQGISTPQEVQQSLANHPAGDVVPVTFNNGAGLQTVQVTLASRAIYDTVPHFRVLHDHGPPAPNYCIGWMWILDGMITYSAQVGVTPSGRNGIKHNFEFPMSDIREVAKNGFYMVRLGAFHIRMKNGTVANFIVVNQQGQYQRPDEILAAINRAMSRF